MSHFLGEGGDHAILDAVGPTLQTRLKAEHLVQPSSSSMVMLMSASNEAASDRSKNILIEFCGFQDSPKEDF